MRHAITARATLAAAILFSAVPYARAQEPSADVSRLPLTWVEPVGAPMPVVAVLLTGDGGWAPLVRDIGHDLAAAGIGVVALNSREFLGKRKTPDSTAAAVSRIARAALARWHATRFVVVGYSRGADMAPFVVAGMPADLRGQVAGVFMFGLGRNANFHFHWIDLMRDTHRRDDVPILPVLERLRGTPMLCVYGVAERESGCRDAPEGLLTKIEQPGDHHFGNAKQLAAYVIATVQRERPRAP